MTLLNEQAKVLLSGGFMGAIERELNEELLDAFCLGLDHADDTGVVMAALQRKALHQVILKIRAKAESVRS